MIYRLNSLANLLNQYSYTGSQFHSCGCKAKKQTMYGCLISKRYYDKQRRHEEEINLDISPKEIIIKRKEFQDSAGIGPKENIGYENI